MTSPASNKKPETPKKGEGQQWGEFQEQFKRLSSEMQRKLQPQLDGILAKWRTSNPAKMREALQEYRSMLTAATQPSAPRGRS